MSYSLTHNQLSGAIIGAVCLAIGTGEVATAASFSPSPLFEEVNTYNTVIGTDGDPTDIYFPNLANSTTDSLPIALMLQGALVDKADYSNFASIVAGYGFVVVVPNNERTALDPGTGQFITGLIAEQQQVNEVLASIIDENSNPSSPLAGIVDTTKLGLLGHSLGGAVGLASIGDICFPILCVDSFTQPDELMAGIFYGASFRDPRFENAIISVDNGNIPTALIAGNRDGVAALANVEATFEEIQNPPKALITIEGANHYGITNEDNLLRDPIRPTIDQAVATETIARWSGLFLRASLLDDADAFDYVYNTGDALDENVSVVSQTKSVPEPASVLSLLVIGTWGIASLTSPLRR